MHSKNIFIAIIILVLVGIVGFFLTQSSTTTTQAPDTNEQPIPVEPDGGIGDGAEPLPEDTDTEPTEEDGSVVIGTSADGNKIRAFSFGDGSDEILLIGGIHGGYSWNTTVLAYELIDYLEEQESELPENLKVTVIPVMNPDGLAETFGTPGRFNPDRASEVTETERIAGRFNGNDVDLNRNFDCEWSASATWQSRTVSGGSAAFSEPEAAAIREYVNDSQPVAAVVWFSSEGRVYPSACGGNPSSASNALASTFATAAGYPTAAEFDAYTITGDMVNWLAKESVPAISVLLTNHSDIELTKNRAGLEAVLEAYAE